MKQKLAVLAAGGTGGHLFPAQALSAELQQRGWIVDLATDERCNHYDFPAHQVHILPSDTFRSRNIISMARTVFALGQGFLKARTMLHELKPAVVIGFGGYPSIPPVLAASMLRIPTIIHEANAVLGRANRLLAPRVSAIGLAAEHTALLDEALRSKAQIVGMPVREAVLQAASTPYHVPSSESEIRALIFGGSQGAHVFASLVPKALKRLPENLRNRLAIVQQVREEDMAQTQAAFAVLGLKSYELAPFFKDMPKCIADAHLVICRSGASSVAELAVIGRPSILVPLPHALDNDQLKNAQSLANAGAAIVAEQATLSPERLSALLSATLQDPLWLESRAKAAKAAGRPNAAQLFANLVEETARVKGKGKARV